ncbi:MAG: lipopolysaccharide heptosyltransferase II [Candidatus Omnitrophica bacterium]|nr:lipopolysaccharide heptosyltransferase II [Candidatus Omnitrophota bacterium]
MENKRLHILVVRTDRIGDVVLTTAAVRALRKNYPDSRIAMMVAPGTRELVEGNPDIDEVIIHDRDGNNKGFVGFWKQVFNLRRKKFDWAIIFHTKKWTNMFCFFAGIPRRTGYCNEKLGFLLTDRVPDDREAGIKHEAEYCLDILNSIGVPAPLSGMQCVIPVNKNSDAWADQWFAENNVNPKEFIIVNPSASDPGRQWPAERFAQIIEILQSKNIGPIAVIGTKKDIAAAKVLSLVRSTDKIRVFDLRGQTSMSHLIALLRQCRMLISNDTGPVHIAAALKKPVVSIFTRNEPGINPERWRPLGQTVKIVVTPVKGMISNYKSKVIDYSYLNAITVESVWEAVDGLLKLC